MWLLQPRIRDEHVQVIILAEKHLPFGCWICRLLNLIGRGFKNRVEFSFSVDANVHDFLRRIFYGNCKMVVGCVIKIRVWLTKQQTVLVRLFKKKNFFQ